LTDSIKTLINDLQIFSRIALFGRSYLTRRNEEFVKVFVTLFQSIAYFFQKTLLHLLLPLVLHLQQSKCRIKFVTSNGKSEAYRNEEKGSKLKKRGEEGGKEWKGGWWFWEKKNNKLESIQMARQDDSRRWLFSSETDDGDIFN